MLADKEICVFIAARTGPLTGGDYVNTGVPDVADIVNIRDFLSDIVGALHENVEGVFSEGIGLN
jgi:hypothetical protein